MGWETDCTKVIFAGTVKKKLKKSLFYAQKFFFLTREGKLYISKDEKKLPKNKESPFIIHEKPFYLIDKKERIISIGYKHSKKKQKILIFKLNSRDTLLEWLEKLSEAGGIRKKYIKTDNKSRSIFKSTKKESKESVIDFIIEHKINNFEIIEDYQKELRNSQKEFLEMKEKDLEEIGIDVYQARSKILKIIEEFKGFKKNKGKYVIFSKICNFFTNKEQISKKIDDWNCVISVLENEDEMKNHFLDQNNISNYLFKLHIPNYKKHEEELEEENSNRDYYYDEKAHDICFVVTGININNSKNPVSFFSSQQRELLKREKNQSSQFLHVALIVGPWYLEWNDSGLIVPKIAHGSPEIGLLMHDFKRIWKISRTSMSNSEITSTLAKVICKWNRTKFFVKENLNDDVNSGNCQDFVEECLDSLGSLTQKVQKIFNQPFFQQFKIRGKCEFRFFPSYNLSTIFDEKLIQFNSHKELDDFLKSTEDDYKMISVDYKNEYAELRSLDYVFWIKHYLDPSNPKYKPCKHCPCKPKYLLERFEPQYVSDVKKINLT